MVGEVFSSALERKRAEEEKHRLQEEAEEATHKFYKETLLAVTEGRLEICEADEMAQWIRDPDMVVLLAEFEDSPKSRDAARCFLDRYDVELEERDMWLLCIGEAVTNALKHVGHGKLFLGHRDENVLWAAVADEGQGIEALIIPKATLMAGFSTKPSLGMGYSIILSHAERVRLSTGSKGTTVMMERHIGGNSPQSLPSLYEMPFTV
jgi:anti-sigma regulatory factor (Ser/Thr protein kinase)